jgi:hypothetical protein
MLPRPVQRRFWSNPDLGRFLAMSSIFHHHCMYRVDKTFETNIRTYFGVRGRMTRRVWQINLPKIMPNPIWQSCTNLTVEMWGLLLFIFKKLSGVNSKIRPIWSPWSEEKMLSACLIWEKGGHQKLFQLIFPSFFISIYFVLGNLCTTKIRQTFRRQPIFLFMFFFLCKV